MFCRVNAIGLSSCSAQHDAGSGPDWLDRKLFHGKRMDFLQYLHDREGEGYEAEEGTSLGRCSSGNRLRLWRLCFRQLVGRYGFPESSTGLSLCYSER